ncbi:MAG TPA: lytic transglycosylase domain-containing protein [Solirubrobacteraceae bacterium]|jgi:hypothetical protein|nr:lytic transglycosylase domain-containing protein [Solirubrobacteraceae bacterium]
MHARRSLPVALALCAALLAVASASAAGSAARGHGDRAGGRIVEVVPCACRGGRSRRHLAPPKPASPSPSGGANEAGPALLPAGGSLAQAPGPWPSPLLTPAARLAALDSLIGTFEVPPFLLPIYQAAGIEYDVPWQVLAAINWIETDFGRNLSVSSAGAMGWMQFMPATWAHYGVDATGSGVKDPYDPIDAIFAAARYLHAAGASTSLPAAVYAYNHAGWYVQSVLLRAQLISGYPSALIDALTELMQARFPVAGRVQSYRHPLSGREQDRALISASARARAVAVADGRIIALGHSARLGHYAVLEDAFGNTYTYRGLGSIARAYAVSKPVTLGARQIARELALPSSPPPSAPATSSIAPDAPGTDIASLSGVKIRLFAYPLRRASYASGGLEQVSGSNPGTYFAGTAALIARQYRLAPLRPGSMVLAGTVLGHLAPTRRGHSSLTFMINPAGRHSPRIDPEPILRSWELSARAGLYGIAVKDPLIDPGTRDATVGQILLMSKPRLQAQVLADRGTHIYACGRRDIRSGRVDQRVLAAIEYLSVLGLHPTITGLVCAQGPVHANGTSFELSRIDQTPVLGHQGPGSLTALTIRALLALQGTMLPSEIISLHSYPGQPNTLALPDHAGRIEVDYGSAATSGLDPRAWSALAAQLSRLSEPAVSVP